MKVEEQGKRKGSHLVLSFFVAPFPPVFFLLTCDKINNRKSIGPANAKGASKSVGSLG